MDEFLARRRRLAALHDERLSGVPGLERAVGAAFGRSAWHLCVVRVPAERRRAIFCGLPERGIGVQVHYMPVHLCPYHRGRLGTRRGDFPAAEAFYDRAISLPLFPAMRDDDVDRVAAAHEAVI